jgi:hypothetical protein
MGVASVPSLHRHWEDWLAMWRIGCLIAVSPWDLALRAFAKRADLLPRRMQALGLDPNTVAGAEPVAFGEVLQYCAACESYDRCEWDLRQDPGDPAWRDYCPNAARLSALARPDRGDPPRRPRSALGNDRGRARHGAHRVLGSGADRSARKADLPSYPGASRRFSAEPRLGLSPGRE